MPGLPSPTLMRSARRAPTSHGKFLYSDVARELRQRIAREVYKPGTKLPSMADLTAEFGVSAITVRHALRELSHEGLISGHQGLGVFVREKAPIHRVLAGNPQSSIGDAIRSAGHRVRIEEIGFDEIQADGDLAAEMQVRRNARLFRHGKITFADDQPVAIHIMFFTPAVAKKLRPYLGQEFIWPLLARHGFNIANLRCEFAAIAANEEDAQYLELRPGFPLLRGHYIPLDADGTPICSITTIARSDRFVFETNLPQQPQPSSPPTD